MKTLSLEIPWTVPVYLRLIEIGKNREPITVAGFPNMILARLQLDGIDNTILAEFERVKLV